MESDDRNIFYFAAKALKEFSRIAMDFAVKEKQLQIGLLGSQVYIICLFIYGGERRRGQWLSRKLPKVLKDVCCVVCGVSVSVSFENRIVA